MGVSDCECGFSCISFSFTDFISTEKLSSGKCISDIIRPFQLMIIVNPGRLLEIMKLKRKWEESKEKGVTSRSVCVCNLVKLVVSQPQRWVLLG